MPRRHYAAPAPPNGHGALLAQELHLVYALLLEEVNQLRQAVGLPPRTHEDIAAARVQVLARLQTDREDS